MKSWEMIPPLPHSESPDLLVSLWIRVITQLVAAQRCYPDL